MKYEEFRKKVKGVPIVSGQYLKLAVDNTQAFKNQVGRWVKAGKLLRLRRGLYILNEDDLKINPSRLFISRELYSPSYVSMEFALAFYGLIPERVADITCVSTKKTAVFQNTFGRFVYQHVKKNCFTGFREMKDEAGLGYFMAVPEKAVVDFLYLNQHLFKGQYDMVFSKSFRLQNLATLNERKLLRYAELFKSKKLISIVKAVKLKKA